MTSVHLPSAIVRAINVVAILLFLSSCIDDSLSSVTTDSSSEEAGSVLPPNFPYPISTDFELTAFGYTNHNIEGFHVLVQEEAVFNNVNVTIEALRILDSSLKGIKGFGLNQQIMDSLLVVPIFVDLRTREGAAVYHPSSEWLLANGFPVEKARAIEISNVRDFVNWTKGNQPFMVLHEFTHAFHHRVMNFNEPIITEAFNSAVENGLYLNVPYNPGNGTNTTVERAYALNNEIEYFAEITEAYFGLNDYFPFRRAELQEYDSLGFNAVETTWRLKANNSKQ